MIPVGRRAQRKTPLGPRLELAGTGGATHAARRGETRRRRLPRAGKDPLPGETRLAGLLASLDERPAFPSSWTVAYVGRRDFLARMTQGRGYSGGSAPDSHRIPFSAPDVEHQHAVTLPCVARRVKGRVWERAWGRVWGRAWEAETRHGRAVRMSARRDRSLKTTHDRRTMRPQDSGPRLACPAKRPCRRKPIGRNRIAPLQCRTDTKQGEGPARGKALPPFRPSGMSSRAVRRSRRCGWGTVSMGDGRVSRPIRRGRSGPGS